MPAFLSNLDSKLVAGAVSYLLTLLVAVKLGVAVDTVLIPGYLTVAQAIALAGLAVAGYVKGNDGTVLRTPQEDGNPELPGDLKDEGGYAVVELLVVVVIALVVFWLAAHVSVVLAVVCALLVLIAGLAH